MNVFLPPALAASALSCYWAGVKSRQLNAGDVGCLGGPGFGTVRK